MSASNLDQIRGFDRLGPRDENIEFRQEGRERNSRAIWSPAPESILRTSCPHLENTS